MKSAESTNPPTGIVVDIHNPPVLETDKKQANPKAETEDNKPVQQETGGPAGPEPTRYGDWEVKGRCSDF
jgi:hypothetical protein